MKHKRYNHTDQMTRGTVPPVSNHYDPLCNDSVSNDAPIGTQVPTMVTSKHKGKNKTVHKKRVSKEEQCKVIIVGDSHARKCATEVSQLLNNDSEVLGFVNEIHKGHIQGKITAVIKERCVGVMGGIQ